MSSIMLDLYIGFFAGREDVYVENSAEVKREPLTAAVLSHALNHHYGISAYMADAEGMTHIGAIDFDTDDGLAQSMRVQQTLGRHNVPSLALESRRGAHLWVGCRDARIPAATMRRALEAGLHHTGLADPKIEVFPKRGDDLAVGALRLPGMPHPKTQVQYRALGTDGGLRDIELLESLLRMHQGGLKVALETLSGSFSPPIPYPKGLGIYQRRGFRTDTSEPIPKASEVLRAWGIVNAHPGGTVNCPRHDDKHRSLSIFSDDQRIYCGAPGCPLNGNGHGVGSIDLSKMEAP